MSVVSAPTKRQCIGLGALKAISVTKLEGVYPFTGRIAEFPALTYNVMNTDSTHAATITVRLVRQLRTVGDRAVVVNYNPETVTTDYDECDALYVEGFTLERVINKPAVISKSILNAKEIEVHARMAPC
eukprot:gene42694-52964_t